MAFDGTLPLDDGYLAEAPGQLREQFRALKDDKIINAGKLKGLEPGNASGNVPINNGTLNTDLNADKLDGHDSAYFSASTHTHAAATTNAAGLMSAADKVKLNGIAAGAEVNQNAYSKVSAGGTVLTAGAKQDTLTIKGDDAVSVTGDASSNVVTLGVALGQLLTNSVAVDDWDNATELGARYFLAGNLPHGPTPGENRKDAFQAFVTRIAAKNVMQVALPYNNAERPYVRSQYFDGIWSVWRGLSWTYDKAPSASAADTATKLQTARAINGVPFDGTGNINISAPANGGTSASCSGNAATATKLQWARAIVIRYYSTRVQSKGVVERTYDQGYEYFNGTGDVIINVGCVSGCATTCISGCADSCGGSCKGNCRGSCSGDN